MNSPKIAIFAYCIAIGFVLAIAVHSSSKTLFAANVPTAADLK